ncbi:hypothetical protein [Spirillospora sp. CA-294931]|uniref:hypothetical protein n=1 Tax=Spirillospora sp. CA-294931 TaxID=3240042 RepID=UPI003D8C406A
MTQAKPAKGREVTLGWTRTETFRQTFAIPADELEDFLDEGGELDQEALEALIHGLEDTTEAFEDSTDFEMWVVEVAK